MREAHGRGPDPELVSAELAFEDVKHTWLRVHELEAELTKAVDKHHAALDKLYTATRVRAVPEFGRELGSVMAMRRGAAFWDRTPAEPPRRELLAR